MWDVASRLSTRVQITTDGHKAYIEAIEGAFGMEVDYAMLIKLYGTPSNPDTRYSPGEVIGMETHKRQNLTMRMSVRRFTRLTNAFSKKVENHEHMLAIYFMYYNFCRIHSTLRVTPAMEAGLATDQWMIEDLVALMEPKSILEGLNTSV